MKYIKKYNENIEWDFDYEEENPENKIPYVKNGITYGEKLSKLSIEPSKTKFKLEDRVVVTHNFAKDRTGKVVDYNGGIYLIYFDDNIGGHDQNGVPKGHAWWIIYNNLKKL